MSVLALRQTIIDSLALALQGGVREVRGHRGQFQSLKEIQRLASNNPALYVCYLGGRNWQEINTAAGPHIAGELQWVCYVLTQDKRQLPRDEAAAIIVNAMLLHVDDNSFGLAADVPKNISDRNLTTMEIDLAGLCLWTLTWQQRMAVTPVTQSAQNDFLSVYSEKFTGDDATPHAEDVYQLRNEP